MEHEKELFKNAGFVILEKPYKEYIIIKKVSCPQLTFFICLMVSGNKKLFYTFP